MNPLALLAVEAASRSMQEATKGSAVDTDIKTPGTTSSVKVVDRKSTTTPYLNAIKTEHISVDEPKVTSVQKSNESKTSHSASHRPTPSPTMFHAAAPKRSPVSSRARRSRLRKPSFALRLHALLSDQNCISAIAWLPSGRSFVILNRSLFSEKCLRKYFHETKFQSFSRRLQRWGFSKVYVTGQSHAVYSHELFQRDRLDLCKLMNAKGGEDDRNTNIPELEQSKNCAAEREVTELMRLSKQREAEKKKNQFKTQTKLLPPAFHTRHSEQTVALEMPDVRPGPPTYDRCMLMPYAYHVDGNPIPNRTLGYIGAPPMAYNGAITSQVAQDQDIPSLDEEISNCEEQLKILLQLRSLRERYHSLHSRN